eukprot:1915337-Prorocentrum_lima.AAC.1
MIGVVRVRAREEEVEARMLPLVTNKLTTCCAASSSSTIPSAAGMEGLTMMMCTKFATYQGCPLGRT